MLTTNALKVHMDRGAKITIISITASGVYAQGAAGDQLDLSAIGNTFLLPDPGGVRLPNLVLLNDIDLNDGAGNLYFPSLVESSTVLTGFGIRWYQGSAGGTAELGTGAYPATIINKPIKAQITWDAGTN